jgi:AraC family transcriptional regulator of adaptative response/methylated-DNA-[protein]-cysteine methyltransferase
MIVKTLNEAPAHVEWAKVPSPAGPLLVGITDKKQISRVSFLSTHTLNERLFEWQHEWPKTTFVQHKNSISLSEGSLLLIGTSFQQKVWKALLRIKKGGVMTYREVAQAIGHPQAFRAVGSACGVNPIVYVVPCHRVVGSNGKLGGFVGGLPLKKRILRSEGYL